MQFVWESIKRKGISVWQGLAERTWCLSETYPIIFSTGRAGLMFHFRKHPLPLDPWPDVWHHPGLFHGGDDVHYLTAPGPVSSAKLNRGRQQKARDTSTMPLLTQKVNYDVGLIRTVKFQLIQAISYLCPRTGRVSKHQTQCLPLPLVFWKIYTPRVTRKNFARPAQSEQWQGRQDFR